MPIRICRDFLVVNRSPLPRIGLPWPKRSWMVRKRGTELGQSAMFAAGQCHLFVVACATVRYMSQPLSLRLPDATLDRLGARARSRSVAPRRLPSATSRKGCEQTSIR